MVDWRRSKRARIAACAALAVCAPSLIVSRAQAGDDEAFVDLDRAHARNLEYLRFATRTFSPGDPVNVLAHLERSRVDPTYVPPGKVPIGAWDRLFSRMSKLVDTRDFDALYLLYVVLGYADHPMLAPQLA
ncbi:MAG TPA: hypothetical protein VGL13_17505, partial [Polyangiaceae bacterium]